MIRYHPDDNLLVEYASGSLAWALSLCVSSHLQFCPHCRKRVEGMNKLGAVILNSSVTEKIEPDTFTQLMQRIKAQPADTVAVTQKQPVELHSAYRHDPLFVNLPKTLAKLLPRDGKLKWQKVWGALKMMPLETGQNQYEVAFQRISSGGKVMRHDHRGIEVTLVLHGSFSDERGVYTEGDFLVRNPGEVHRPTATQNEDCLCLAVTEAPVSVTGFFGKLINPFLTIKPA